jgi:hypothetical protein
MSLFDEDLAQGGLLQKVVKIVNVTYPNGDSIWQPTTAKESGTTHWEHCPQSERFMFGTQVVPDFPEIDRLSEWPMYDVGFVCNQGEIQYFTLFKEGLLQKTEYRDIRLLVAAGLQGHMDNIFIPLQDRNAPWMYVDGKYPMKYYQYQTDERHVSERKWWNMVMTSLGEGVENWLDPDLDARVFVRNLESFTYSGTNDIFNSYIITIKINGHKKLGDIFWPYSDFEENRLGRLYGDQHLAQCVWTKVGCPVSISLRVELEYIGDTKEKEQFC